MFTDQLKHHIQLPCLWSESFNKSGRTVFIKPKINIFNFKRTDLVLDRIKQNQKRVQGWEEKRQAGFYTGSLIQSYIQFHLIPRWNPLEIVLITYKHSSSWTLQEQYNQCWKTLFQHTLHSKKPIKEWLTLTPLQTRIKERLHLKRRCKNSKPVVQFAAEWHQHLHQDQRFPRTSTLQNPFGKPFKNLFNPSSHIESVWSLSKT